MPYVCRRWTALRSPAYVVGVADADGGIQQAQQRADLQRLLRSGGCGPVGRLGLARRRGSEGGGVLDPSDGRRRESSIRADSQRAATGLWAATSPMLDGLGGLYLEDCDVAGISAPGTPMDEGGVRDYAVDADAAARLWELSVAATGAVPVARWTSTYAEVLRLSAMGR